MTEPTSGDSVASIYDGGYRAISLDLSGKNKADSLFKVDLSAILESKDPKKAIQAIEPIKIFHSLVERGSEDSLSVLPLLSEEQVTRIFDYDIWREGRLVAKQAFGWLKLFGEIGPKELFKRFSGLDEEYQLAIMGPFIRVYDQEEFELLSDADQDRLIPLPSNESYYEIISEDKDICSGVEKVIEAAMDENMAYAISLIAHASYMPPAEQEFEAARFRNARVEEDGFVTAEESRQTFYKIDIDTLKKKYSDSDLLKSQALVEKRKSKKLFIDQVLSKSSELNWTEDQEKLIQQNFMFLANHLCSASNIETDDAFGLKVVLKHAKSLSSLGLEFLSNGNIELASKILIQEYPKRLFQVGLNLVAELRDSLIKSIPLEGQKEVLDYLAIARFGAAQEFIDRNWLSKLGFNYTETIKGVCNRYPVLPQYLDEKHNKVVFSPISSIDDLARFTSLLGEISGTLQLLDQSLLSEDLDRSLKTACVQSICNQAFKAEAVSEDDISRYLEMSDESIEEVANGLIAALNSKLENEVTWYSRLNPADVNFDSKKESLGLVVHSISSHLFEIHAVRSQVVSGELPRTALENLIFVNRTV